MKIRFIKPATAVGFGYRENETADLLPESAVMLIDAGYAEAIGEKKDNPETRESKALPETRIQHKKRK